MKIFVAGHKGMVGSAITGKLRALGHDVITADRQQVDLQSQLAVATFMATISPDAVVLAAAKVGGISANSNLPASFIYENLAIQNNVIHAAYCAGVTRLLFLGSSCIYPRMAPQPIPESALLSGPLEPSNEPYAMAKLAGIKLCESYNRQYGVDYRSIMPTNLYGPGDNFHPEHSHVLPALLRRFHEAKEHLLPSVTIWGTGKPCREFLHVDDMADASVFALMLDLPTYASVTTPMQSHINIGVGKDISIADLASLIARAVGYEGEIVFDPSKPDGTPKKLLDISKIQSLGWAPKVDLTEGVSNTYEWYLSNLAIIRG
jgi:GDP-L-fucose synthase